MRHILIWIMCLQREVEHIWELLILFSWIQTANLDGETNLKIRKALERTWDYIDENKAVDFRGIIYLLHECSSYYLVILGIVSHF